MIERENNYEKVIEKILNMTPNKFENLVKDAIEFSKDIHKNEERLSGEDFIMHPLNVTLILAELHADCNTLIAGILHNYNNSKTNDERKEIRTIALNKFGEDVINIIDSYNEISVATSSEDTDPEIITKYILKNSHDIRPLLVKLADVVDNVRTIKHMPQDRKKGKLLKVFDIYGPLAEYLNLNDLKKEIEELAFKEYRPEIYESIEKKLLEYGINEELKKKFEEELDTFCEYLEYKPQINGRIKSKYSIFNKLKKHQKEWSSPRVSSLDDLIAFRIITKNEKDCYEILEKLFDNTEIKYEYLDDYIAHPKPNGYRAIQAPCKFYDISDIYVEIQIMTHEMYYHNTYGPASHIAYKASKSRFAKPTDKFKWVENLHNGIQEHINSREDRRSIPITCNIFENETFAFTPKSKIIPLEKGSTVLDFAYKVHTQIGHSAVGAKVNGKSASLEQIVHTGDIIEIRTDKDKKFPNDTWLNFVKSETTKKRIEQGLKKKKIVNR